MVTKNARMQANKRARKQRKRTLLPKEESKQAGRKPDSSLGGKQEGKLQGCLKPRKYKACNQNARMLACKKAVKQAIYLAGMFEFKE